MLITKEVEVKIVGRNVKYYEDLGYQIPRYYNKKECKMCFKNGQTIMVKIIDIPKNSHVDVIVECDYCEKKFHVRYDAYNKQRINDITKDCCNDCKSIKNTELNLLRYGVENQFQRENIKIKRDETMIARYGERTPMKIDKFKVKIRKTLSKNNNIETSRQQVYLYNLLGGELNYSDDTTHWFNLDIAFPKEKIYIEYDGSGHDLQVKFGNITKDEFEQKEIVRYNMLKRNGWRCIKIISKCDYLPCDKSIFQIINNAREWFEIGGSGHHHYNVTIGNKLKDKTYGKLRKITEKDIIKEAI